LDEGERPIDATQGVSDEENEGNRELEEKDSEVISRDQGFRTNGPEEQEVPAAPGEIPADQKIKDH
jgi:hypothetical protein